MAWATLLLAGLFETAWAIGMKVSDGFTRLWPSVWTVVTMLASIVLLARAVKVLPIGTAYAVWTGIGAAGAALIGVIWLHEPASIRRVACIALIVAGTIGLRLVSPR